MKYLYLDNFRGFTDTFIPIADVSFLVGENSTGKTSVLGLLKLLSNPRFWLSQEFDTEDIRFGHFKDIVSIHSKKPNYFTFGIIEDIENPKTQELKSRGFLMTFKQKAGLPRLSHYTLNKGNSIRLIKVTPKQILLKEYSDDCNVAAKKFIGNIFNSWIKEHITPSTGYTNLKIPIELSENENIPILFLSGLIDQLKKNKSEKGDEKGLSVSFSPRPIMDEIVWLAPIRTTPKRTYDEMRLDFSPDGTHTPYLVRKILASKSEALEFKKYLDQVGKQSALFESVSIRQYGNSASAPFELDIIIDEKALNINSVGYGVSQSLPVIVELIHRKKNTCFAIQQPEVHLHPKAQAALGDLMYRLFLHEDKRFLVETHSDFLIDRFRLNYRNKRRQKPDAQILFFERKEKKNTVTSLVIDENGDLPPDQPKSYREFFIKEEMKMLGL